MFHPALAQLNPGQLLKIQDAKGQSLAVFDGLVWVTQDGDPRDAFVAKGGVFTFDRQGLAIVEAMKESHLAVLATAADVGEEHEPAFT
jgi:hypothetical protein